METILINDDPMCSECVQCYETIDCFDCPKCKYLWKDYVEQQYLLMDTKNKNVNELISDIWPS